MNNYIQLFESWQNVEEFTLTSKMPRRGNPEIIIKVKYGRIESIDNESRYPFPFFQGQPFQKPFITGWACKNGFYLNGEEPCGSSKNDKIFGIKKKYIPQGHEWRIIFPGKFRD
jgi:hypothetical protein